MELVVVKVLFLEPGDLALVSDVDSGLCKIDGEYVTGEDLYQHGFLKLDPNALADSLRLQGDSATLISSPNDPVSEVLKPFHVVYIEPQGIGRDWSGGGVKWHIDGTSLEDCFGFYCDDFVAHARHILSRSAPGQKSENGVRVHFHTLWNVWSSTDYQGEHDSGLDLMGVVDLDVLEKFSQPLYTHEHGGDERAAGASEGKL